MIELSDGGVRQLDVRFPRARTAELAEILECISTRQPQEPYCDEIISFCAAFSRELARRSRGMPELQALAFWMRKTELNRLREEFRALHRSDVVLAPRGLVLHVPPANVDTIFVYSWLLAVLAGNVNVIRLSSRSSEQTDLILDVLADVAAQPGHTEVAANTFIVRYGHEDAITAALSLAADVRVVWGGDGTVLQMRRFALQPHATELTFPDRASLAAIDVDYYLRLGESERHSLAERFFNDSYWFDQLGCSSPRAVVWVGEESRAVACASAFFASLDDVVSAKAYRADTATAISKLTFAYRAVLDRGVTAVVRLGNEIMILPVEKLAAARGEFAGAGTFFNLHCARLVDLADHVERRDQTLSHAGFDLPALRDLARSLNGRGIDRMVPLGEALNFNRFWDGNDLLQSFVRRVYVSAVDAVTTDDSGPRREPVEATP